MTPVTTGSADDGHAMTEACHHDAEEVSVAVYEAFVRQHCSRLVRSLTLMSLDPELAADAAQEAFIQLYTHWNKVQSHEAPEAWLYRVAINRCKDHRRYLTRVSKLLTRIASQPPIEGQSVEWDSRLDAQAMLGRLPTRQRTAAALHFEADLSVADIAVVMNISEGTVKSHLFRARESLRQILEAEK